MVTLTERAGALLEEVQTAQGLESPPRLVQEEGGIALTTSAPDPADDVLYHGETPVLRVSPEVAGILSGCTITTQETPQGAKLAIVRGDSPDGQVTGANG